MTNTMIAEFGHIALIFALLTAFIQAGSGLLGAQRSNAALMRLASRAALLQSMLTIWAFAALTLVFIQSDFSVKLAASHSHSAKPFLYKISGVWGNHEGSMLLWIVMLSLFGAFIPIKGQHLPKSLKARAIAVQGLLGIGFLSFLLFTSNPFERLFPVPSDGNGLNPLLQDPGLALHPPFLYLGYVGFSVAFSFSVAALMEGRVDAIWARWLRPWVLIAWSFLTIGITLGSVWAYYELGWGGWWMWDPVENVSFMPWLAGTALVHSVMVLSKRHMMASWTVLLGISTFSLSLIGTFVVRSGLLTSVHSFAVDPERGVFILILLLLYTGGALALYAMRAHTLRQVGGFAPVSKEGGLLINNILLVIATATVFLGTFYPLGIEAFTREKISVGAPYFDLTFAPIMCLLIVFMSLGPRLNWRKDNLSAYQSFFVKAAVLLLIIAGLTFVMGKSVLGGLSLAISAWLIVGTLSAVAQRIKWGQVSSSQSRALLKAQPGSFFGFVLAHISIAIFTIGVTFMSVWAKDDIGRINVGESLAVAGYSFTLDKVSDGRRDNYAYLQGEFTVTQESGRKEITLSSERRFYPIRNMVTTEAGFNFGLKDTVLVSLSEGTPETGWIVRAYYHPMIIWIWIGALLMALAGFWSLRGNPSKDEPAS